MRDTYLYRVRYRRADSATREYRMSVSADNPDEARAAVQMRDPQFSSTIETPRRLGRFLWEPDPVDEAKRRDEIARWRDTDIEVVD